MKAPKESQSEAVRATSDAHEPEGTLQRQVDEGPRQQAQRDRLAQLQADGNRNGLPQALKNGIESLSGLDMSDVRVHRNSARPAQMQAHAYAQGNDIHLAPGQEKHLPHEAWHVVQQKQGRVRPTIQMKAGVPVNDDRSLEHEADVMGAKALQMKFEPNPIGIGTANLSMNPESQNPSTLNAGDSAESGKLIQRVEREAKVTWAITHLVQVQDHGEGESLFGKGDDWKSGEVSPENFGQLSNGQLIIVDDKAVFMSRRGANQENRLRRDNDKEADELKYKWLKVLKISVDGAFRSVPEDTYVRAETIELSGVEKPLQKGIHFEKHDSKPEGAVLPGLEGFHDAWKEAAKKRRRSIGRVNNDFEGEFTEGGDEITSGSNWDQYDEGENVSGYVKDPSELKPYNDVEKQHIFSASYSAEQAEKQGEEEPIAYMVIEECDDEDGQYMYIRWLIAHPEKGGGGSALVKKAIDEFEARDEMKKLRVDSAFSAVSWYERFGFKRLEPENSAVKKGVGYADTRMIYTKPDKEAASEQES